MRSIIFAITALILMGFSIAFGQATGTIRGVAITSDDDPIHGITARVLGTSPARGAISREDGSFIIRNIPVGTYDIQLTGIGLHMPVLPNVHVSEGDTVYLGRVIMEFSSVRDEDICVCDPQDIVVAERVGTTWTIGFYPLPRLQDHDAYYR